MKLYSSYLDECSGIKAFSVLPTSNGRALIGLHYGYFTLFWRIFYTNYQLIDKSILDNAFEVCSIEELTKAKLNAFLSKELTLIEKIHHFIKFNILNRKTYILNKERELFWMNRFNNNG